jgi:t-SNARE complex subunit (syntaxin)
MPFLHYESHLSRIEKKINAISELLTKISTGEIKMAVTLDQLTTDVNTLQTAFTTGLTDLEAEIANLKANNPQTDFTAIDTIITGMSQAITAADPGAQTINAAAAKV